MKKIPDKTGIIKRGIARKFILYILLFGIAVILITTTIYIYLHYSRAVSIIEKKLKEIETIHLQSIVNSMWVTDYELLRIQLEGILQIPDMQFLAVTLDGQNIVEVGIQKKENIISRKYPLEYSFKNRKINLGTLQVGASMDGVYKRLIRDGLITLLIDSVIVLLICIFQFILFYLLVGRYLETMAHYTMELKFDSLDRSLILKKPGQKKDELDQLAFSINSMRKRLTEEVNEREKLIIELESKNTELERFSYTVSHDLKSPLVTINGYMSLLEEDVLEGNTEMVQKDIFRIKESTEKMQMLLDDLLELSRAGQVTNPEKEVHLGELIQEAIVLIQGLLDKKKIEVEIKPDLPVVFVDEKRYLEVFQNLIENAIKFMDKQKKPHIEIGATSKGKEVLCYVKDNGKGIEPKYFDKIFEIFHRLDNRTEGSGIGLAIVKRIIEAHGGKIWLESDGFGKGVTFFFTAPIKN